LPTTAPDTSGSVIQVPKRPPAIARMRLPFGYMAILGAFIVDARSFQWWALLLVALGSFFRMWSAGTLVKTKELSTDGPYAVCRNPLYLGTFLAGLGLTLFVHSLPLVVFFLVTFFFAYRAQILWEEKLLTREHGDAFRDYCGKVDRFVPTRWRPAVLQGSFSLKRLMANKELAYQVFWLVMLLGLVAMAQLRRAGIGVSLP